MSKNALYQKVYQESHQGTYTAYLRGSRCTGEVEFFREISASFQFPCYFGENWTALDECLCDLEWLNFARIFIAVDDFNLIFNGDKDLQALLIKYFTIMIEHWEKEGVPVIIWLNSGTEAGLREPE